MVVWCVCASWKGIMIIVIIIIHKTHNTHVQWKNDYNVLFVFCFCTTLVIPPALPYLYSIKPMLINILLEYIKSLKKIK